jgi:hypothetical protein
MLPLCLEPRLQMVMGKDFSWLLHPTFQNPQIVLTSHFFYSIITISDNHVASPRSCMKHVTNNLLISYFIVVM